MTIIQDVQPRGYSSAYVAKPFDVGKKELEQAGYHIISLEENARLRIQEGKDKDISRNGNWVREGFLYVPGEGKFLTKNSPVMENPVEATTAHRKGSEFYLTDEQVEKSLVNSIQLEDKDFVVPTKRFGEDKLAVYVFGNSAQAYGDFLKDAGIGINEMPVVMVDNIGDKPFVRQAWFSGLVGRSRLVGCRCLYDDDGVRGSTCSGCEDASASEPNIIAEGGSQQDLYSPLQISRALDNLGFSGLNKGLLEKLKQ